ncbi:hypothetical protein ACSNOI_00680 [Actinomadura kijaniata]|uniref:hypothetical protein n=1 Tax=Actinomadura kijaniata TaxID=46161 RepID=UPI003F1954D8
MDVRLAKIIDELVAIVQAHPQNLLWGSYENEQELIDDLRDHAARVRRGDHSRLFELKLALLPTGALCEIAINSGWADAYVRLANQFDTLY